MSKIFKYRIYCTTDNKWEYIWDLSAPTICPVDGAHSVNANSVSELGCVRKIQHITNTHSPYTITGYNFYKADTTSGNITINLKTAADNKDRVLIFQKTVAANILTIDADGVETIGGLATQTLTNAKSILKIQSDGSNWSIVDIRTTLGDDKLEGTLYDDNFNKGDIIVNNGLDTTTVAGIDNTFLKADSTQPSGVIFVTETVLGDSNVAALAGINANKIADGSVSSTEFQYINSLTSNAQTQFNERVVGPVSATDNAIVRWDATTGKLVQNSAVLVDDTANITGISYLQLSDIAAPSNPSDFEGRLYKKTGDDGIFWKPDSAGAELDLTRASTLTVAEITQLENINTTAISITQWGYLGTLDQALATTNGPTFNGITSTSNIDASSNKIINLALPTSDTDAANKAYVDSVAQGLDIKNSVRVTTTGPLTLATDFENGDTIDGVVLVTGDKILIKNQVSGIENGIYIVQASGVPIRSVDMQAGTGAASSFTFVEEGTVNQDSGWVCTTNTGSDIVGTNELEYTQFSGAGQINAGEGLSKTGNTLYVNVDTTSIIIDTDILKIKNAPASKGQILTYSTEQTSLDASATNNYVLVADSAQTSGLKWGIVPIRLWVFQDVKTIGTFGGSAIGDNTWRKRDLNTVKIDGGVEASLASDQITLTAGTYHIQIKSTFFKTQGSKIRFYNVTDVDVVEYSLNAWASDVDRVALTTDIDTYININASKVFEIQYACDKSQTNDGLGIAVGLSGVSELYTVAYIKKL